MLQTSHYHLHHKVYLYSSSNTRILLTLFEKFQLWRMRSREIVMVSQKCHLAGNGSGIRALPPQKHLPIARKSMYNQKRIGRVWIVLPVIFGVRKMLSESGPSQKCFIRHSANGRQTNTVSGIDGNMQQTVLPGIHTDLSLLQQDGGHTRRPHRPRCSTQLPEVPTDRSRGPVPDLS